MRWITLESQPRKSAIHQPISTYHHEPIVGIITFTAAARLLSYGTAIIVIFKGITVNMFPFRLSKLKTKSAIKFELVLLGFSSSFNLFCVLFAQSSSYPLTRVSIFTDIISFHGLHEPILPLIRNAHRRQDVYPARRCNASFQFWGQVWENPRRADPALCCSGYARWGHQTVLRRESSQPIAIYLPNIQKLLMTLCGTEPELQRTRRKAQPWNVRRGHSEDS